MSLEDVATTSPAAGATVATRDLVYFDGQTKLNGQLHWDSGTEESRPGLLLIHGGAGLDAHARQQAHRYASQGFAVLACDMFGEGVAGDRERTMATIMRLRQDARLLVARGQAGVTALAACPEVREPHAVVGFCFGGMAALALARAGTNLRAAVSIHGSLSASEASEPGKVLPKILVCHGARDPYVSMEEVAAFADEMVGVGADWQLNIYGRAMHGFTHTEAVTEGSPGVMYEPTADRQSFAATCAFLSEALPDGRITDSRDSSGPKER